MLWKLLGLQKKLDALFDEGWVCPGFVCTSGLFFDELLEPFSCLDALETGT
jgi:hypothetical protein